MKLSICTDVFGKIPFTDMLDKVKAYGLDAIELTTGGWGGCFFVPSAEELIKNPEKLRSFKEEIDKRGLTISALNCSGNPLIDTPMGHAHSKTIHDTVVLAELLGVKTIVTMSGLPGGAPGDKTPNWIASTVSWPEFDGSKYMVEAVTYQWKVAKEWWTEFAQFAKDHGIEKIAIEEFPCQLVHNVRSLNTLVEAVGPELGKLIGMNLDPSHLMIQGADPIAAARALGDKIFYVHGKDARIERGLADVNGLLENLPVTETKDRTWNYVAVGCGKDLQWWKEFFSVAHMMGYDGFVSLEMEDLTMSVDAGLKTSIDALKATISQ
ncbi:sugar phosphate isomerase/epimerase [uncultured Megasphaera sp.]|uniref:sugar phosphate isomerase/epimerase family protein n=1 Tax=uncultured Megasphaera sp. TaxID=165188 RepID=UPI0025E35A67|nr:sugar phosphate isomerase/epimerase [uncultured Megasphaera sp.]